MKAGDIVGGKYELTRLIAQGAMGEVYEAQHIELRRTVAVKALRPELCRDEESTKRFVREARAAATIGSEHIAAVTDVGQGQDGAPYLVMEYVEGETLARVLRAEGRLDAGRAARVGVQLCWALAAAHDKGIVHRDMKPDNVFLVPRPDGTELVKIVDFGIAKVLDSVTLDASHLTAAGTTLGTPYYMAPEQARAEHDLDGRVDIYSVGVVLYEMLTGKQPFAGGSFTAIVVAASTTDPVPPSTLCPDLPPGIEAVVLKAMARERNRRFATARELADALEPFVALPPTRASCRPALPGPGPQTQCPPTEIERPALVAPRPPVRRRLVLIVAAVALVLAAAAAGGWLLYQRGVEAGARFAGVEGRMASPSGGARTPASTGPAQPSTPAQPVAVGAQATTQEPKPPPDAAETAPSGDEAVAESERLLRARNFVGCLQALAAEPPSPRVRSLRLQCLDRSGFREPACQLARFCQNERQCREFSTRRCAESQ
jgi:serine/threonine-protein kinase